MDHNHLVAYKYLHKKYVAFGIYFELCHGFSGNCNLMKREKEGDLGGGGGGGDRQTVMPDITGKLLRHLLPNSDARDVFQAHFKSCLPEEGRRFL